MTASLHQRLREATAASHAALERDLDWQSEVATLSGYRNLLRRLRGFHAVYEPAIGEGLRDEAFFAPRRRLAKLDADLTALGLTESAIRTVPMAAPIALNGRAPALGALYVLEGSTLGGLVIGKAIARLHGFDASSGCAYYRAHGRATAAMWAAFCAELETVPERQEADVLRGAVATFDGMRHWLVPAAEAAA